MSAPKRQIAALSRAVSRRQRVDQDLRARLAQFIAARVPLVDSERQARDRASVLEAQARSYRQRISAMMAGAEPFSIDTLTAIRLYADEVDRGHAAALDALKSAQQALAAHDATIANTRGEIAKNRGRIDLCEARIGKLQRVLDGIAADAEDEDVEETALARLARA
ncbi:type III secretion protein [Paraburkholderia sp. Tr-20389]|uniref:type III secretion protein n=1 Tax=Paraburkholderia sp. Tr-20389 TaxID=2703903 RepID=UPI00197E8458|nr:type III secretion protein [Paraburkholderia sp. Tr-20389]MBN3751823.1 type III secretion protein [Paraburkholderia sp. Tr-20389]